MPLLSSRPLRSQPRLTDIFYGEDNAGGEYRYTLDKFRSRISVMDYGAVGDGVTDDSAAFNSAMTAAAGGPLTIPEPSVEYLVKDCQIPSAYGCHLVPEGKVTIKWDGTGSWGGMYFRGEDNFGPEVAVSGAITDDTTYPTALGQTVSKIPGVFTGYAPGDICYMYSTQKDVPANFLAEYFVVLDVDPVSSAFVYANKKLYHDFDAVGFAAKVRRVETVVPFIIEKGITFAPNGDTTINGARRAAIVSRMPIRPDITVQFDDVWKAGLQIVGSYLGKVDATAKNIFVNYALSGQQLGYVVQRDACCFGTWFRVNADKSGALCDASVLGGTYVATDWFKYGTVLDNVIYDSTSHNCRRSAFRTHGSYREIYMNCRVIYSAMDDEEKANFYNAFAITGRDATFMGCSGIGTKTFLSVNGAYGSSVSDTFTVMNCYYYSKAGPLTSTAVFIASLEANCPDKAIEVIGGSANTNKNVFFLSKTLKALRFAGGFTARTNLALGQTTVNVPIYYDDLTLIAETGAQTWAVTCQTSNGQNHHVGNVRVMQNAANQPSALFGCFTPAVVNIHTDLRGIVSQTGSSLDLVWSGSSGTSTTAKRPVGPAFSSTIPSETKVTYEDGFVVHNTAPTAGGKAEWRRTTTGWKLANPIDA